MSKKTFKKFSLKPPTKETKYTIANDDILWEYFSHLLKNSWLHENKKYLLLTGGTEKKWNEIVEFVWKNKDRLIPEPIHLIVQKNIDCCNKNSDELVQRIFFNKAREELNNFKDLKLFLTFYNAIKDEKNVKKLLSKMYSTRIETLLTKYKAHEKKHTEMANTFSLRCNSLVDKQKKFFDTCKDSFLNLEVYDGETKGFFFVDLLDTFKPILC